MPDKTNPPPPVPPVVVAVNPSDHAPTYVGEERRQGGSTGQTGGLSVNIQPQPPPTDQSLLYGVPPKWSGWVRLGTVGVLVTLAVVAFYDMRAGSRRAEEREDRRYLDAVEMQRATSAENGRNMGALINKFEALIAKVDASMDRVTTVGSEVRTSRVTMEQMTQRLEDALSRLFAELKRLVPAPKKTIPPMTDKPTGVDASEIGGGFFNPIWWLVDHAPPKVMDPPTELAPRPRIIPRPTDDSPAH